MKVEQLLRSENEEKPNVKYLVNGLNALHIAAMKGHYLILTLLLSYQPDCISSQAGDGRTALMLAAFESRLECLRVLFDHCFSNDNFKSALLLKDDKGNNVLHFACWGGSLSCVRFIMEQLFTQVQGSFCGKSSSYLVLMRNNEGLTPVQLAAAVNSSSVVQYLLEFRSSTETEANERLHDISDSGMTILHRAANHGATNTVRYLLSSHLPINLRVSNQDNNGSTALHFAAKHGYNETVRLLCDTLGNADLDMKNAFGLTPLHYACIG